jgi:hypothetical protein
VQVLSQGPNGAHIRWNYYGSNMYSGEHAYYATEDFWAMPNGVVLRKQSYVSLMPAVGTTSGNIGYAREPIELIGMAPAGKTWADVLQTVPGTQARHALAVLDPFSTTQANVYWTPKPGTVWDSTPTRDFSSATWAALNNSAGTALVLPLKGGSAYTVFGDASGFQHDGTNIKDHTYGESTTAGEVWGSQSWDHWPIGWGNSQGHIVDSSTLPFYPNHFSPMGMDLFAVPDQQVEAGVYYSIISVGSENNEAIRSLAHDWLSMNSSQIFDPASIAQLPAIYTVVPEPGTLSLLAVAGAAVLWFHLQER